LPQTWIRDEVDGLDRPTVTAAVRAAAPAVIVHQMTALADMCGLRQFDRVFAGAHELRTTGTDNLLAAAAEAGTAEDRERPARPESPPVDAAVDGGDQARGAGCSGRRAGGRDAAL
jgi:hypothetical protein